MVHLICCIIQLVFVAGHLVGGLSGIFLGWGIGPTLQPTPEAKAPQDAKQSQNRMPPSSTAMQMQDASRNEPEMVPNNMSRINTPLDGIRRVSISAAFLAGLIGIVAATVVDRVGHVPLPKGLGL